jgi:hypothetical protein
MSKKKKCKTNNRSKIKGRKRNKKTLKKRNKKTLKKRGGKKNLYGQKKKDNPLRRTLRRNRQTTNRNVERFRNIIDTNDRALRETLTAFITFIQTSLNNRVTTDVEYQRLQLMYDVMIVAVGDRELLQEDRIRIELVELLLTRLRLRTQFDISGLNSDSDSD